MNNYAINSVYEEDVSTTTGTELIYGQATVWEIIVSCDTSGTAVLSFSNTVGTYDVNYRSGKIVVAGPGTQQVVFPKGLVCTTGLCVVSSMDSVDVQVSYD
jgi:hypothetical protein